MKKLGLLMLLVVLCLAGCGNVYLSGDAMTAAEASALQAYGAYDRMKGEAAAPAWIIGYERENYLQWRYFVRAAKRSDTWGPKLEGE